MPDTSKLEKLNRELEKSEKKLRKAINDEKALQHQLKQLTRKERTHRLCTRGGMLESFCKNRVMPDNMMMFMLLLKLIFHRQDTQGTIEKTAGTGDAGTPVIHKGDNYTPPRGWCIAFSEGSSPEGCDFPQSWSASNQTGDATLPLRWLPPATLL